MVEGSGSLIPLLRDKERRDGRKLELEFGMDMGLRGGGRLRFVREATNR